MSDFLPLDKLAKRRKEVEERRRKLREAYEKEKIREQSEYEIYKNKVMNIENEYSGIRVEVADKLIERMDKGDCVEVLTKKSANKLCERIKNKGFFSMYRKVKIDNEERYRVWKK